MTEQEKKYLGILIVILIVIIFYYNSLCLSLLNKKINGTFTATNDFLEISNLGKFILHINNKKSYLFISDKEDKIIFNDTVEFRYSLYWYNCSDTVDLKLYIPELVEEWKTDSYYNMHFDVVNNTIDIYDSNNTTLFAGLIRVKDVEEEEDAETL